MENNTELLAEFELPEIVTNGMRTYSVIILLENLIVATCLYTDKGRFYKREFWLLLISVNIRDILMGIAMFLWSFKKSDIFSKNIYGCGFMKVAVLSSWISLMCNIMCACVHRIILKFGGNRMRFGWRCKTTIYQVIGVYLFSMTYMIIPFALWSQTEQELTSCEPGQAFGQNQVKAFLFVGMGSLTPLLTANIIYGCLRYLKQNNAMNVAQTVRLTKCGLGATRSVIDFEPTDDDETQIAPDVMTLTNDNDEDEIETLENTQSIYDPLRYLSQENREMDVRGKSSLESSLIQNRGTYHGERYTFSQLSDSQREVDRKSLIQNDKRRAKNCHHKNAKYSTSMVRYTSPDTAKRNREISDETQGMVDAQNQIIGLIGIVLLLENLTALPCVLSFILTMFIPQKMYQVLGLSLSIIAISNAFFHPWIYAYQSKEFREALTSNITGLIHAVCPCLRKKSDRKTNTPNIDCRYE